MIFTIGVTTALLGYATIAMFGSDTRYRHNGYDWLGAGMVVGGALLALFSLATLAWKYLP